MASHPEMVSIMHKVLDKNADNKNKKDLTLHLKKCRACREHFEGLKKTTAIIQSTSGERVPESFKDTVLNRLPKENKASRARRWFHKHPISTAAALFLIFMTGYLFSLWEGPQQVSIMGTGHVKQGNHMVIVPKGEVIHGNLIVRNSNVKIEGKVLGDVTVINGKKYLASAGQVTGHIHVLDALLEWIWYQVKHLFTGLVWT